MEFLVANAAEVAAKQGEDLLHLVEENLAEFTYALIDENRVEVDLALEDLKEYVDFVKEGLIATVSELMPQLVDVRWDIQTELRQSAWEYPSYGWDWSRNLTGSSWGT